MTGESELLGTSGASWELGVRRQGATEEGRRGGGKERWIGKQKERGMQMNVWEGGSFVCLRMFTEKVQKLRERRRGGPEQREEWEWEGKEGCRDGRMRMVEKSHQA